MIIETRSAALIACPHLQALKVVWDAQTGVWAFSGAEPRFILKFERSKSDVFMVAVCPRCPQMIA